MPFVPFVVDWQAFSFLHFGAMRILVLQHIVVEHPGALRDFMAEDGVAWDAVELDLQEPIPPLGDYDGLLVMGGPMDVWEEDKHPWLVAEKAAIREAVLERGMPFLGVCLGHQLLADALGGEVRPMAQPEVGILEVELTVEAARDPLFADMRKRCKALQWHGAEVTRVPPGGVVLGRSPACAVQAFRAGPTAWGIQYHVELTPRTVPEWGDVPAYRQSLQRTLGAHALDGLKAQAALHMESFRYDARRLYDNFMRLARHRQRLRT